jgi:radical SAM superfamily enzyme YgiQ (UPF0313 family)
LVDAPAWKWGRTEVLNDVINFQPDLVVVDSSFPSLDNDLSVSKALKEILPRTKIVFVGPPSSQFPDIILQNEGIDVVASWEYDFTLRELADAIEQGSSFESIKGISFKKNGRIIHNPDRELSNSVDLDELPFVSKVYQRHLNIKDYYLVYSLYPEVQIFTGRGCPFRCTFCSWPQTLMGRKYRVRSIPNVIDEFEWIEKNLPQVKEIFI